MHTSQLAELILCARQCSDGIRSSLGMKIDCLSGTSQIDMQHSSTSQAVVVPITETGIAWSSDVSKKFSSHNATGFNVDPSKRGGGTINGSAFLT